jgi:hypothetical protein
VRKAVPNLLPVERPAEGRGDAQPGEDLEGGAELLGICGDPEASAQGVINDGEGDTRSRSSGKLL